MNDTVRKLLGLADEYADRPEFPETRQALEAELVRLFTPLTDEQIQEAATLAVKRKELNWAGFSEDGYGVYTIPVLSTSHIKLIRAVEKAHGIVEQESNK